MVRFNSVLSCLVFCVVLFCWADVVCAEPLVGRVVYNDSGPTAGAVVYLLDSRHRLRINNGAIMIDEKIPRAITDKNGRFTIKNMKDPNSRLFVRDMEDNSVYLSSIEAGKAVKVVMQRQGQLTGRLLEGDNPVKGGEVAAILLLDDFVLESRYTTKTNQKGRFIFPQMMPGAYLVQTIHEVPQVGCSFRSVVTKQVKVEVAAASKCEIQLGGSGLPYLQGEITDANGDGLHGVWVRLLKNDPNGPPANTCKRNTGSVWSDVSERDGSYVIYDIPPGEYNLQCYRRLALNNYSRTLRREVDITIKAPPRNNGDEHAQNIRDVTVDLAPFMPLEYGQLSPPIMANLLTGQRFNLAQQRGKVVVLHFYAGWCSACSGAIGYFDKLTKNFGDDKLVIVGVNLDDDLADCQKYIAEKKLGHPQIFDGPWSKSILVKEFRIVSVPSTIIIDAQGKISQMDLFNEVLEGHIRELFE